jgi:hypothetical protein
LFLIQICFLGRWVTLAKDFATRDDAEWQIGLWKQANNCRSDACFRTVNQEDLANG